MPYPIRSIPSARPELPTATTKLRFLKRADSSLASEDDALILAIRAELLGRPNIVEEDDCGEADAILMHESWAFREWRYIDKLLADPVISRYSPKVYTVNNDDAATGLLRGAYSCLPARRFDADLHVAVPFLARPNEEVLAHAGKSPGEARCLGVWRGNPHSNRKLRGQLLQLYGGSKNFKVESTDSWKDHGKQEKLRYVQMLRSGKFSLCPGGWAPATIRTYESMAVGVAPVIIADEFVLPRGPDWSAFSLRVKEADLPSLEAILEQHAERHEAMGALAYEAWHRYFRPERLIGYYADMLMECVRTSASIGTPTTETARWRSPSMYRNNGWTVGQRLWNRASRLLRA
jgi:hypothetical protein